MQTRKLLDNLKKEMHTSDILLIVGARQVGKSTIIQQLHESITEHETHIFTLEDPLIRKSLDIHPDNLFEITLSNPTKKQTIFIDEIQYLKDPTNFLKYVYDKYRDTIKLVVTGSSSFYIDQKFRDSLAGRKKVFHLYPLSFDEFLMFRGESTLSSYIYTNQKIPTPHKPKITALFNEYVTYGGYPKIILTPDHKEKEFLLRQYTYDLVKKDFSESGIRYEQTFLDLFHLLAEQSGDLLNARELSNTLGVSYPTIEKYLYLLEKSFHIQTLRPFHQNLRKELTKMPKMYLNDLGVRNALLGDFRNRSQRTDKGSILENIAYTVLRDNTHFNADIQFRRTQQKHEVDFIYQKKKAYECKYNPNKISHKKYSIFTTEYPNIPLEFITHKNILEFLIKDFSLPGSFSSKITNS